MHLTNARSDAKISSVDVFYSAAIAPDGNNLALGLNGAFSLQDNKSAAMRISIDDSNAAINTIAFSRGSYSSMLALGTSTGAVWLYDVNKKSQVGALLGKHKWDVVDVTFAPRGKVVVSAAANGTIKFWDVQTKREIFSSSDFHKFETPGYVKATALSPDGEMLALGATNGFSPPTGTLQLWGISRESLSQYPKRKIDIPGKTYITTIAFSPDSKMIAAGAEDGTLFLWNISKRTSLATVNRSKFAVTTVAFSLDGEMLVAGTGNGEVSFWDPHTFAKKKIASVETGQSQHSTEVLSAAFSDNGKILTSVDATGSTLSWNLPVSPKREIVEGPNKERSVSVVKREEQNRTSQTPNRVQPSAPLPVIEILSPKLDGNNSVKIWKAGLTVKAKVIDHTGLKAVSIGGLTTENMRPVPNEVDVFTGRIVFRQYGMNFFNITATPENGKPIVKRIKVNFVKDETAPQIAITGFTQQYVSGTVTDQESGINANKVKMGNERISLKSDGSFTHYPKLREGDNTFTIAAVDEAGNTSNSEEFLMHRVPIPPKIKIVSPKLNTDNTVELIEDSLRLSVEVIDESEIASVTINGEEAISEDGKIFTATIFRQTGFKRIEIVAMDKAGGTKIKSFGVEFREPMRDEPTPTIVTPVRKTPGTVPSGTATTTPVSELEVSNGKTPTSHTTVPGGSTDLSNTTPSRKEEDDPRITFINDDLDLERPYNTSDDNFLLAVYVVDKSQIPSDGVRIERKVGIRTYRFIAGAYKKTEHKYEASLPLNEGVNEFRIMAEDEWSNIEIQLFTIIKSREDTEGPIIEITQVGNATIHSGEELVTVSSEEILVRGSVTDVSGIHSVEVNGVTTLVRDNGNFEAKVLLDYGENPITVIAKDQQNRISDTAFTVYQRPDRTYKDFALFFATDKYSGVKDVNGNWSNLQSTVRDAKVIAKNLRDNYGFETRIFENYSKQRLLNTIHAYKNDFEGIKYEHGSQLLIFFSGHGYYHPEWKTGYLITADTDYNTVDPTMASALDHTTLRRHIDLIACERILVLLDTCFSGTFDPHFEPLPEMKGVLENMSLLEQVKRKLTLDARWCLTASGTEYVLDGKKGHSPFTSALLDALNSKGGDDSLLVLEEVWEKVQKSNEASIYDTFEEVYKQRPQPRKGQFGTRSFNESDFLFFPVK